MKQRYWVLGALVILTGSASGLYYVISRLPPEPHRMFARPQIIFFLLTFLMLSAGTVPFAAFFNHRFANPAWPERDWGRLLRQGCMVGGGGILLLYLQLQRTLNWTVGLVLVGVLVLIEFYFLTRE